MTSRSSPWPPSPHRTAAQPPAHGINPWVELPDSGDLVLPVDREAVDQHNRAVKETDYQFILDLLPEPFLGAPDAPVVLLNLNPGFSEADYAAHEDGSFSTACRAMLRHERTNWPFYLLDPEFAETSGAAWWRQRLRVLAEAVGGYDALGQGMLVVEMYGYHSRRFKIPRHRPPSVDYGVELVRRAIEDGRLIIFMRARRAWTALLPELTTYHRVHELTNPQSPYFSPKNCPTAFDETVEILRGVV